jgi:hypothetical protein
VARTISTPNVLRSAPYIYESAWHASVQTHYAAGVQGRCDKGTLRRTNTHKQTTPAAFCPSDISQNIEKIRHAPSRVCGLKFRWWRALVFPLAICIWCVEMHQWTQCARIVRGDMGQLILFSPTQFDQPLKLRALFIIRKVFGWIIYGRRGYKSSQENVMVFVCQGRKCATQNSMKYWSSKILRLLGTTGCIHFKGRNVYAIIPLEHFCEMRKQISCSNSLLDMGLFLECYIEISPISN